jgi:hypothetical protein
MCPVQKLTGDESEHGITEELEAFVRFARAFPGDAQIGTVRQREPEEIRILKANRVVARELLHDARFLFVGRPSRRGGQRRAGGEQVLEPAPETGARWWLRRDA